MPEVITALPDQPVIGSSILTPLGGDGFSAPMSAYTVSQTNVHDAAVGANSPTQFRFDPRYTQLVSYMNFLEIGAPGAVDVMWEIQCSNQDRIIVNQTLPLMDVVGLGFSNVGLWTPPAILCSAPVGDDDSAPWFRAVVNNVNGESSVLRARIYNFDKRARELVPLPQLLASLTRGTDAI